MSTDPTNTPISIDDFHSCGWESILQDDPQNDLFSLSTLFRHAASNAHNAGNIRSRSILDLLARVTSIALTPEDKAKPFKPAFDIVAQGRTTIPDDFTEAEVKLFSEMLEYVPFPPLKARLADMVWSLERKRRIVFAHLAIDAYRYAAPSADTWFLSGEAHWQRALMLALTIGAREKVEEIEMALLAAFEANTNCEALEASWFAATMDKYNLAEDKRGAIAEQLEQIGTSRFAAGNFRQAREYFAAAVRWFQRAKRSEQVAGATILIADCYETEAERHNSKSIAMDFFDKALQTLRSVPIAERKRRGITNRLDELERKVATAGFLVVDEMKTVQSPAVNISELVQEARDRVQGLEPGAAIIALAKLYPGPNEANLRAQVTHSVKNSLVHQLFSHTTISKDGRQVAQHDAVGDDPKTQEIAIAAQMVRDFTITIRLAVQSHIIPALQVMHLEHSLRMDDFLMLANESPLVPIGCAGLVAQGLYAGYCHDFAQAIHLLIPQTENMVRMRLKYHNATTTTTSADGNVMEVGLSNLVVMPEMERAFGRDVTFELRAVFCDQYGPNLRNELAHGLLNDHSANSEATVYAWWFIYRLVVGSFWDALLAKRVHESGGDGVAGEA